MAFDDLDRDDGQPGRRRQRRAFGPQGRTLLLEHVPTAKIGETEMPEDGWDDPYETDPDMFCPPTWAGPGDEALCTASERGYEVEFALRIPREGGLETTQFHWVVADKAEDAIDMACTIVFEELGLPFPPARPH